MIFLFNISHDPPYLDMSHQKCYDCIEEISKAKGDNEYANRS